MRRALSALSAVLIAATIASVTLLFVPGASSAAPPWWEGGPSQGSFTTGRAGPNEPSLVADTPPSVAEAEDSMFAASAGKSNSRSAVVQQARRYLGTKYKYATCTARQMSCTCLTKSTWAKFGHGLPMSEDGQWKYKRSKRVQSNDLRPGDIVFFAEGRGGGLTHVGIYSGKGNLVHASAYFGKVVESKMKYIKGYSGAIRLKPR